MALKTLQDIKKKVDSKQSNQGSGESPFVSLKDGESVKIRFIQEFDTSPEYYDERRGTIEYYDEHANPKDFKKSAKCSAEDEGRCWACEQTRLEGDVGKKWKGRSRFLANVIVRGVDGAPDKVKLLKGGFSDKGIGSDLISYAEEYEGLGGQDFKLTRKGSGMNDTSYTLIPLAGKKMSKDDLAHEVIDLSRWAKAVSYDEQPDFYNGSSQEGSKAENWIS